MSFVIAVISAMLIMLAAHYKGMYLREIRYNRLLLNMDSGIELLLADGVVKQGTEKIDLFGEETDSVELFKKGWGVFEVASIKTFISTDTLKRSFFIGKSSIADQVAMYLSDEDRPISISGNTRIKGGAMLPKSGIKQSYAEGRPYSGKELVYGNIKDSKRTLPELEPAIIKQITESLNSELDKFPWLGADDLKNSFFDSTKVFRIRLGATLSQAISGNVILYSDTTVRLSAESKLNGIQIYAPFIKVEDGFKGICQLFASDSISIGNRVTFDYPSSVAVVRTELSGDLPKITSGEHLNFNGILFSYEEKRSALQTLIALGKGAKINGEIYATGIVKLEKGLVVKGKIACNRFLMQTAQTLYENFLIDVELNRKARSRYYLSSPLFKEAKGENKILKWLN